MPEDLIFGFIFIISLQFGVAINYSGVDVCNNTKQHTLCEYEPPQPSKQCGYYERTIQTEKDKEKLLKKINERRNKVASGDIRSYPSAENMLKMEWNEDLAISAQKWVEQCIKKNSTSSYDACRDRGQVQVGQTIATVYGEAPGLTPLSLVDVWYTELLNANASVIHRYMSSSVKGFSHYDHFTQLVWARSSQVGCGGLKFKEHFNNRNRTVHRLVCNFVPRGNIVGEEVYRAGLPCSGCPDGSACDFEYMSMCSVSRNVSKLDDVDIRIDKNNDTRDVNAVKLSEHANDTNVITDESVTFDFISQYFDFTRQMITEPSTSSSSCKDLLAVDEFIELLKKKLSNDPLFKELLMSTTSSIQNGNGDATYADPNVAMFVSKLYSKKVLTTTTKIPEEEYVNSTLLVDLVENVIFRSGVKTVPTPLVEDKPFMIVNPVKVQAELAEVKVNRDFTGHYFFPEDHTEELNTDTTDTNIYDETTDTIPVSDVVMEIENIKRTESTKDFLEDLIEFDIGTEIPSKRRKRYKELHNDYVDYSGALPRATQHRRRNIKDIVLKYRELLKNLAADLKVLKLNERFHCSYSRH